MEEICWLRVDEVGKNARLEHGWAVYEAQIIHTRGFYLYCCFLHWGCWCCYYWATLQGFSFSWLLFFCFRIFFVPPSLPPSLSLYLRGGRGTEFPYNLFIWLFVKQCLQDIQKGRVLSTSDPCSKEKEAWTIFLFGLLSSMKIVLHMHHAFSMEQ